MHDFGGVVHLVLKSSYTEPLNDSRAMLMCTRYILTRQNAVLLKNSTANTFPFFGYEAIFVTCYTSNVKLQHNLLVNPTHYVY